MTGHVHYIPRPILDGRTVTYSDPQGRLLWMKVHQGLNGGLLDVEHGVTMTFTYPSTFCGLSQVDVRQGESAANGRSTLVTSAKVTVPCVTPSPSPSPSPSPTSSPSPTASLSPSSSPSATVTTHPTSPASQTSTATSSSSTVPAAPALPATGADLTGLAILAAAVVAGGGLLVRAARRGEHR